MARLDKRKSMAKKALALKKSTAIAGYGAVLDGVVQLLEQARRSAARAVNSVMTVTYWEIGRRIVEFEQYGADRAKYGEQLLERLAADLTMRFGRGFSATNLRSFRNFYLYWPIQQTLSAEFSNRPILQTPSAELPATKGSPALQIQQTLSAELPRQKEALTLARPDFPLSWSHYVRMLSVEKSEARKFYEVEALRGGWSVRQLDRQISSLFYERTALSRNKAAMLRKGASPQPGDEMTPEEEIKDPVFLEFLGLKDEYSESDLEEALIRHLEAFLLELGGDFAFVGRQMRLRIGDEWFRVDLVFFHRRLRCLVVIDLKLGKFTHADAGQMHMYLNYATEHWTCDGENPPVGLILCARKDAALAKYALGNLPNKVLASEYRLALPQEKVLAAEIERTQQLLESRFESTHKKD
jgi:predicted nuclease of restriction endonuclease-like (RecB) superfamily